MILAPLHYWFPGSTEPPAAYTARFRDATGSERGCFSRNSDGPVPGIRGCLASPMLDVFVGFRPAVQRWDRIAPGVWLGAGVGATPAMFARPRQYNGYRRTLGDGNEWVIPIANPWAALCSLPAHDVLRDGAWVREIDQQYRGLSDRAAALSETFRLAVLERREVKPDGFTDGELRQLVADVLALNYDLTLAEMSALRLFDPMAYWPVVQAFIDWESTRDAVFAAMEGGQTAAPFGGSAAEDTSATPLTALSAAGTA